MKRKSVIAIAAVAALISVFTFAFAACGDTPTITVDDEFLGTSDPQYAVEGMSAYDLIMEAYDNWCNDDGYVRSEQFVFTAQAIGGIYTAATRNTDLLRKVDGDRIYSQEVILGTGADDGTKAIRYYFDGTKAWESENTDKADISLDSEGLPMTSDWGEFVAYDGDIAEQNRVMTEHLTTYDFSSRDYLSDKHNDTVYKVGDLYYCTMTIDCSIEMMNTVHKAAKEEFLANTGADEEGFSIEDTTIDFAIAEIDGEYKFVAWVRHENYSGMRGDLGGMTVECSQSCYSTYAYTGYEITSDDIGDLS